MQANGAAAAFEYLNGHIIVPSTALKTGRNEIVVTFNAGDASLNRSADFMYALFVPARARQALPVFDQPDLKARWTLDLTYPAGLAGGEQWRRRRAGSRRRHQAGRARLPHGGRLTFAETEPLPTYLFSFVVGDFKVETATRNGRTFRMFHRETDAAKVARNRDAIFDLHAARHRLARAATPASPTRSASSTSSSSRRSSSAAWSTPARSSTTRPGCCWTSPRRRTSCSAAPRVIAHETAHMWFGDLVTMRWFNDVWMKEVFANFMAAKIVNPSLPRR